MPSSSESVNSCIITCTPTTVVDLRQCFLTNDDFSALKTCFDSYGRGGIIEIDLSENEFTTIPADLFKSMDAVTHLTLQGNLLESVPAGLFDNMASLDYLNIEDNALTTLPSNIFADLGALTVLSLGGNQLSSLPVDAFTGLSILEKLHLDDNALTTLPEGIFENLGSGTMEFLDLSPNSGLQCIPSFDFASSISSSVVDASPSGVCECTPATAVMCAAGQTCEPGAKGYICNDKYILARDVREESNVYDNLCYERGGDCIS